MDAVYQAILLASGQSFWLISFEAKSEIYHTAGFELFPLWWDVWRKVFDGDFVFDGVYIFGSLDIASSTTWRSEKRTVTDLYYGGPQKVLTH